METSFEFKGQSNSSQIIAKLAGVQAAVSLLRHTLFNSEANQIQALQHDLAFLAEDTGRKIDEVMELLDRQTA